jgi:exodeoxyribonuclease-1
MPEQTLYFYDLETSGINPRQSRIMQFAGQRTDLDLNPIGEPDNILVKMTNDILPEPQAILVTKITPQSTLADGIKEKDFAKYFTDNIATPNTTIVGYNTIRFDNEFIRFLLYRNFYDAYEWSYKDGVSTWEILDLTRMTRALRPEGIEWPFAPDGKPSNRLELLTSVNKISHVGAHDALSDVKATIEFAKLIKAKQPKLYEYNYAMRDKTEVANLVNSGQPFVYTSGRYSSTTEKTTIAVVIAEHPLFSSGRALVYDLLQDPEEFMGLSTSDLVERMSFVKERTDKTPKRLPVKDLAYNKCPAVAPIGVLKSTKNKAIDIDVANANLAKLKKDPTFIDRIVEATETAQKKKQQSFVIDISDVDGQLYDGFFNSHDKKLMGQVRAKTDEELADFSPNFSDERLSRLLLLYKARQSPKSLNQDEQKAWEQYREQKLMAGGEESALAKYLKQIQGLMQTTKNQNEKDLLQELWFWGESIAPISSEY